MIVTKANVKQKEIWWVNLTPQIGAELRDPHLCVILQKDTMNKSLMTTIVAPFVRDTFPRGQFPLHAISVPKSVENGLDMKRWLDISQIRCVDATTAGGRPTANDDKLKYRFMKQAGALEDVYFWEIEKAFYATFKDIFSPKTSN